MTAPGRRLGSGHVLAAAGVILALALLARVMTAPLRHDEQLFFTAGMLWGSGDLYRDFGYNHLPNLPLLLSLVDGLVAQPFTANRGLVFIGWLAAAAIIAAFGWRATRDRWIAALGVVLLVTNPLLIDRAGTLVTNNFLPVPFALGGLLAFVIGADRTRPRPLPIALAGFLLAAAIGLKANYVLVFPPFALAAILVPPGLAFADRLRRIALPLVIGGIVGGLPTLIAFAADPQGVPVHVLGYHRGPHRAWAAQQGDLVVSLADRVMLAQSLWASGATLLVAVVVVTAAVVLRRRMPRWPVLLTGGLVVTGMIVSFVPVPSFPQYFAPPLPFAIVLMLLLLGEIGAEARAVMAPLLVAVAGLALAIAAPRLLAELPGQARPGHWTRAEQHRNTQAVVAAAGGRRVATLSPVYVVEAGGRIYPELAAGPFVYRVADLIPAGDRRHYRLVSAATLPALLDADPPGAVLVGLEGDLDAALRDYALRHGFVRRPLSDAKLELYVPR